MRHNPALAICCASVIAATSAFAQGGGDDVSVSMRSGSLLLRSTTKAPTEKEKKRWFTRKGGKQDDAAQAAAQGGPAVVGFERRLSEQEQAALAQKGVRVIDYLEKNAYIARVPTLDPQALRELSKDVNLITHVATLDDPKHKAGADVVSYVRRHAARLRSGSGGGPLTLTVVLWPDADVDAVSKDLESIGKVVSTAPLTKSLQIEISSQADLQAIAAKAGVRHIEPSLSIEIQNDSVRWSMGASYAWNAPNNLRGTGVTVGVFDGALAAARHPAFQNRLKLGETVDGVESAPNRNHATHVSGIIAGTGDYATAPVMEGAGAEQQEFPSVLDPPMPASITERVLAETKIEPEAPATPTALRQYAGMAPGAEIVSFSNGKRPGPVPFVKLYSYLASNAKLDVVNNSWGQPPNPDAVDCSIFGSYNSYTWYYDTILNGRFPVEQQWQPVRRIPIVFSGGNYRNRADYARPCNFNMNPPYPNYQTIVPVATAKNVITVGAIFSNNHEIAPFSSFGPTKDRRIKPDVVAPGCRVWPQRRSGILSPIPEDTLGKSCGTSMAAPAVTGAIALMMEALEKKGHGKATLYPSTYKALLIHGAEDLGRKGPDYQYGFGRVRLPDTLALIAADGFRQGVVLNEGQTFELAIQVPQGSRMLRGTLAWDDRPAALERNGGLVNDLDLELVGPGNAVHLPLVPSTREGEEQQPARPGVDRVNVVEQATVETPAPGSWKAVIKGTRLGLGPQPFSIVLTVHR